MSKPTLVALALTLTAACGDDPVSYSAPVGLSMKVSVSDVDGNGVALDEKGITTESGNPWGTFVSEAQAELGGAPGDIDLDQLTLRLESSSTNVTELRAVFDGVIAVQFQMNGTDVIYEVGSATIDDTIEGRDAELDVLFDYAEFTGDDLTNLLGGSFDAILSGPVDAGFVPADGDADLQLTFSFSAYE